jgi:uncharacterized protein (DUF305 family)
MVETMRLSTHVRSLAIVALSAVVAAAVLAGCGTAKSGDRKTFNEADVAFASGMIPHHQQAVVMADWAVERASDPKVKALAERITAAQGPEITTMTGWLKAWDQPVPDAYDPDSGHGSHSMEGMDMGSDGMMSADDMKKLDKAQGAAFDREFLTQMIEHHEGAIEMAEDEVDTGRDPSALKLARQIEKSQTAEIAEMKGLLAK